MSVKTGNFAGLVVSDKQIECNSCAHFFITWNKRFPFGCRAMGFMSANSPSKEEWTYQHCENALRGSHRSERGGPTLLQG